LRWKEEEISDDMEVSVEQEWESKLDICDADTDVIFEQEKEPLTMEEYLELRDWH